eukprot:CAMPEP_0118854560 /NCGR_PEP_ID=MMETSP1163-20130328/2726_1 /TAXON_ID=124430 /ORGANISM="Phaeomonas parva, Strain CCMP2877" /LENGTH=146 /DNA_ID=CAMNT_0006787305 /DNA_START=116 /DNA_END=556 /DNA_ORIENTATION=+
MAFRAVIFALAVAAATAFVAPSRVARRSNMARFVAEAEPVPEEAAVQNALYDMIYVERLGEDTQSAGGVFLPTMSGSNQDLHMARVLSVGDGREGENGLRTMNGSYKEGDIVFLRNAWGIGPRDEEFRGRKFSFVREQDVCAHMET